MDHDRTVGVGEEDGGASMRLRRRRSSSSRSGGIRMGILETMARDKPIMTFFSRVSRRWTMTDEDSVAASSPHIPELSAIANSVVARCSRILLISTEELKNNFEAHCSCEMKKPNVYARQLLEYCCDKTLHVILATPDYLSDKAIRELTYDMMLALESTNSNEELLSEEINSSSASVGEENEASIFYTNSTSLAVQVDCKNTVGFDSFKRIATLCPTVADMITVHNLFDALTCSSAGQLHFLVYDKYLGSLEKTLRSARNIMSSSLPSSLNLPDEELILAIDGDMPIHPVIQHIGMSAWPGRLILTTQALYFDAFGRGSNRKVKIVKYDLVNDLNQVIKRELTGPLGARLFDKAVMYKSSSVAEPIYFEFPELKGHSRRDYWVEIIREVLHVNRFIRKYNLDEVQSGEAISKAILGIFRYAAVKDAQRITLSHFKTVLTFNLIEKLPKGDMISEALYNYFLLLETANLDGFSTPESKKRTHPLPMSLHLLSRIGFIQQETQCQKKKVVNTCSIPPNATQSLEKALQESLCFSEGAEVAHATLHQVKVESLDTNIALLLELLFPLIQFWKCFHSIAIWEDSLKSSTFLISILYLLYRRWFSFIVPLTLVLFAVLLLWNRCYSRGYSSIDALEVRPPPSKNAVEQILSLQDSISRLEDFLQAGNIILLKLRSIVCAAVPKATDMIVVALVASATMLAFVPYKQLALAVFLELFTREMPLRKQSSDKFRRRMKEWWARIPAAPVQIIRSDQSKKRRTASNSSA